uniref:DUF4770 domain-containing protein n=1 Tax=Bactrocera latifrons TaxID=174628 RepID=A0A0K8VZB7_BACLA
MSNRRRSSSIRRNNKFKIELAKFLKDKDVPQWYRAFSTFQLNAADQLMMSIRDDVEQDTAHRVRYCLSVLGLQPLLENKDLKLIMQLSGGNDLAFLWFLMESHYKTSNENEYSLNEQLILSGIAHLDMITTLRGLDGLLPRGHKSKRTIAKYNANIKVNNKIPKKMRIVGDGKLMPYFQRLERPKQINATHNLKRPDYKVRFRAYEKYKDANYEPPNEKNRWFAMYTFKETVRVPLTELRLYFDGFFKEIGNNNTGEKAAIRIIDSALRNLDTYSEKTNLCLHHQRELEDLEQKKIVQEVEKREKCLQSLDLFNRKKKEERLTRIHEALEKEVAIYRSKYKDKVKNNKEYLHMLSNANYSEYSIRDDGSFCTLEPYLQEERIEQIVQSDANIQSQGQKSKLRLLGGGTVKRDTVTSFLDMKRSSILSETDRLYIQKYDYGHQKTISPTASQLFFESPTGNKPYKFNYEKIFNCEYYFNRDKFIKKVCARMLEENANSKIDHCYDMPNVGEVARKYADTKWDEQQKTMRQCYHRTRKAIGLTSIENLDAQQHLPQTQELPSDMPAQGFYDCEDKELMHSMLRSALAHLAKNPKYVLASLPDCHKLPCLREWIYERYGKRYTYAERVADFAHSRKISKGINNLRLGVQVPTTYDVGKIAYLHPKSTCHKYMLKKAKRMRADYFRQTNKAYMENARLMWLTMNDAQCSISQRDIFFSYMPQRMNDLHHINPWSLRQVKDMKTPHDKRQREQRSKATDGF